jgi:alanine racemase
MLDAVEKACSSIGSSCHIHIKVDTGMGRFGITCEEALSLFKRASAIPHLMVEGIFTHFSRADHDDETYTRGQIDRFIAILNDLERYGLLPPAVHMCNSPGLLKYPEAHFNLVRSGLMTYGLSPYTSSSEKLAVEPVMNWSARIVYIKDVPAGFNVSYGGAFITTHPTRLAIVPVGYADGYRRCLSNGGRAIVNSVSVPIAGKICMDHTVFDITGVDNVHLGDTITLIGADGCERVTVEELADIAGTINYEITTCISGRVPRIYTETV